MEFVKLKHLLAHLPTIQVRGSETIEISSMTANSRQVAPGALFIAKKGLRTDGVQFIPDAVAAGAVAVLTDLYNPFYAQITQLICSDIPEAEALLAKAFYGAPDERLFLVGITGTNGKTTTSYLVHHLLTHLKVSCGLIGTIQWIVGSHILPSTQTTPDIITNYKLLHDMNSAACVMEVSSHALEQGRTRGLSFDAAIFTNLTQDHLDYHPTMEAYAAAKAKIFSSLQGTAIVNADSPWTPKLLEHCSAPRLTYGIDSSCDLRASNIELSAQGTQFHVSYQGATKILHTPLIGRFNVYNILAAASVGLLQGYPLSLVLSHLSSFAHVAGRLERVHNPLHIPLFVDYAHTDDALSNVLSTLREIQQNGKIITLFGCGGERDPFKRPKMGAVAEALSDYVILTSDNPRNENPETILRQIQSGFVNPAAALVIPDRKLAIQKAIELATPQDIVLLAGKGHETQQIFAHQTLHFDDREVALSLCQAIREKRLPGLPIDATVTAQ